MNEEEEAAARAELLTAQLAAAKADRTIKLNDFTGDNVPFINWMQHVNMSIAAAAWSQETSATRVQLALKGRAGVWFQNQLVLGVEGLDVWYPPEMGGGSPSKPADIDGTAIPQSNVTTGTMQSKVNPYSKRK